MITPFAWVDQAREPKHPESRLHARRLARSTVLASLALAGTGCGGRPAAAPSADAGARQGRHVFVRSGCGSCHALAAAGTRGGIGPDFDTSERLNQAQIRASLVEGSNGMPSYARRLDARQMTAVTVFLYRATHRRPEK